MFEDLTRTIIGLLIKKKIKYIPYWMEYSLDICAILFAFPWILINEATYPA